MRSYAAALIALSLGILPACSGADDDLGLPGIGNGNTTGEPTGSSTSNPTDDPLVPAPGGLRRLLARQYVSSVRSLFGDVAALAAKPPADSTLHGFDNVGATELALPATAIEAYEASARDVAQAVIDDAPTLDQIVPCEPTGVADSACYQAFVTKAGRIAWRRPLDAHETDLLVNLALAAAAEYQSFELGLGYAIMGLLQSPYFIYSVEVGEPDPQNPPFRKLTGYELASRMSFFLLDTTPDAALLDKVDAGALAMPEGVRAVAAEMVAKPQARAALASFFSELYRLRDLSALQKDTDQFPKFTATLPAAMKQEALELINDIIWVRNADARELFTADYAFVNAELAGLYGVAAPPAGFKKTTLPGEHKRSGILGSAAFLSRFSHPGITSPTRRGLFVQSSLLCDEIPPPPVGVDTTFPADDPNVPKTMKQKLQNHMKDPNCNSCHAKMDPIGFALENFDAIGGYRVADKGLPIDPTGSIEGLGSFASARDLGAILSEDPRGAACIIRNLYRNSMGHLETKGELPALRDLEEAFATSGYRVQTLLVELVASPAFQLVNEPK
jgi:hypothetical protein